MPSGAVYRAAARRRRPTSTTPSPGRRTTRRPCSRPCWPSPTRCCPPPSIKTIQHRERASFGVGQSIVGLRPSKDNVAQEETPCRSPSSDAATSPPTTSSRSAPRGRRGAGLRATSTRREPRPSPPGTPSRRPRRELPAVDVVSRLHTASDARGRGDGRRGERRACAVREADRDRPARRAPHDRRLRRGRCDVRRAVPAPLLARRPAHPRGDRRRHARHAVPRPRRRAAAPRRVLLHGRRVARHLGDGRRWRPHDPGRALRRPAPVVHGRLRGGQRDAHGPSRTPSRWRTPPSRR